MMMIMRDNAYPLISTACPFCVFGEFRVEFVLL